MTPEQLIAHANEMQQAADGQYSPPLGDAIRATYLREGADLLRQASAEVQRLQSELSRVEAAREALELTCREVEKALGDLDRPFGWRIEVAYGLIEKFAKAEAR